MADLSARILSAGSGPMAATPTMVARIAPVTIHAERHGRGPAVLWTHGFGSSGHLFDATSAALRGHSLGGYLSLRFAQQHAQRTAGLVLVGTGPGYRQPEGRARWNEMCDGFARDLDAHGLDGLPGHPYRRGGEHRSGAGGLALAARETLPQRDNRVLDELDHITAPALVVVGERDRQFLASSELLAARLPGADPLVIIPDCGHTPPDSRPEEFVASVRSFLERHGL